MLEADVALPVVKDFIAAIRERAVGHEVLRSVTPGQMVVKIVHDHLVDLLGRETSELNLSGPPPRVFLMVGLQGSGKTTTSAKIAYRLRTKERRRALLASLDVQRPAAQEQLAVLADQAGVASLPIVPGQTRWRSPRAPSRRRRVQATTSSSWIPPAGCTSTRP